MPAVQKALRVAVRAGLVVARPIIGRADYEFVRGHLDAEAAAEKAAKRDAKK